MNVSKPCSTNGRKASCCALLKRCTSSRRLRKDLSCLLAGIMRGRVATCTTTLAKDLVIRDNPVKAALAAGKRAYGAMVFEFFSPGLPQICKNAGAEFVLFDMEHTGLGFETLKTQCALCRGLDIVPMARVPRGEYHFIARALDIGALGVRVPMVGTQAE